MIILTEPRDIGVELKGKFKFAAKLKLAFTLLSLILLLAFISGAFGVTGNEQIWTDKPDYSPGETVTISGSGFEPLLPVTIKITAPDTSVFTDTAITEADGTFTYNWVVDPGIEGTYLVEAIDQSTGTVLATTTFTDAAIKTTDAAGVPQNNMVFWTGGAVYIHGGTWNSAPGVPCSFCSYTYWITDGVAGGSPIVHGPLTGSLDASGDIPAPTAVWDIPDGYVIQDPTHNFKVYVDVAGDQKSDNFKIEYGAYPPLDVTPATATNVVGTSHTVTVTVKNSQGGFVQGAKVFFELLPGSANYPNSGWASLPPSISTGTGYAASYPTDINGQTYYTYIGNNVGTDTIKAIADNDLDGVAELDEPSGTASKDWITSGPILNLSKSANPPSGSTVNRSGTITYTLNYSNTGTASATATTITDTIPAGTTLVPGSITGGGSESGGVITWNLGTVSAGGSGSVSFQVTVNNNVPGGTTIQNSGTIDSTETTPVSSLPTSHSVSFQPNLNVSKSASPISGSNVNNSQTITYTLNYSETTGLDSATGVTLTDTIPAGTTLVPGSITGGGSESGGVITWNLGTVSAGGSGSVSFQVTVNNNVPGGTTIQNSGTIDSDETDPVNSNQAQHTVAATPSSQVTTGINTYLLVFSALMAMILGLLILRKNPLKI